MKFKMPSLQTQILLALFFGAVFGAIFNVNPKLLNITYTEGTTEVTTPVHKWDKLTITTRGEPSETFTFGPEDQLQALSRAKFLKKRSIPYDITAEQFSKTRRGEEISAASFSSVTSVKKEETIATSIKFIGDIFIRLLNMIAIPLVLGSLIVGAASLGDIKKFARIGGKTISFYVVTTAIAVTIGLTLANVVEPGKQMDADTKEKLMSVYQEDSAERMEQTVEFNLLNTFVEMVPKNPFRALAEAEMLQIVFFSVLFGMVLTMLSRDKSEPVLKFFDGLSETMIKMVDLIMLIAPYGVFALIAATVGEFGFEILETLIWYSLVVVAGLLLHTFGTYGIALKIFTKFKYTTFYKAIRRAQTIGFSTSSSAATLPVTMECCQDNLGVKKSITSFVLPLGATINMDGTAMYQGIATVFIAQVFGMDLSIGQQITVVLMATFASIGTAPVPGVGLIMLIIILKSVGVPQEGIALILGVDRILDMMRTVTNVTGDSMVTTVVAVSEGEVTHPEQSSQE